MQLIVTQAKSLQALQWIKQAWRIFTQQPGPFMGMAAIVFGISLLALIMPIFSYLVVFVSPFLTAGFYQCASRVEQGEQVQAGDIFFYLSQIRDYFVFIRIAMVSVILSIPVTMSAAPIVESLQSELLPSFGVMLTFVAFLALNFMLTAFAVPAAWVSPKTPVMVLIQQSFKACWVNVMPLTLYGLLMALITLISAPILVIGWLIAGAIGAISFYQMFLDFYRPQEAEGTGRPTANSQQPLNSGEPDHNTEQDAEASNDDTEQPTASAEQNIESQDDGVEPERQDRTDNRRD